MPKRKRRIKEISLVGLDFTDSHQEASWSISANRETVTINGKKMSSAAAFGLCESIIEVFEKEKRAFDFYGNEVIIP